MSVLRRALRVTWLPLAIGAIALLVWHHMSLLGDTFWCLAAGDIVLDTHALPTHDPFTFTESQRPWILHMPAFQVGAAWVMRHGGPLALLALGTITYTAAHLLVWLHFARTNAARIATLPLVVLAIQVESADICVRGQIFGDLAFASMLLLLFRIRRGQSCPLYLPILLGTFWANVHPSFLLGGLLPAGAALFELADPPDERGQARTYLRTSLLFAVGASITPYALGLAIDVIKLAINPTTADVDLFNSPNFQDPWWALFVVVSLALVGLRALAGGANVRSDVLVACAFFFATCRARRFGPFLSAFEIAVAGRLLCERGREEASPLRLVTGAEAVASLGSLVGIALALAEPKVPFRDVPVEAARYVLEHAPTGHVIDAYHWGGYLDWAWKGTPPIAYDGRNQLFDDGTWDDMGVVANVGPGWGSILEMYEAETVLWESGAPLDRALAQIPEWQEVHRDRLAVVYRRRH